MEVHGGCQCIETAGETAGPALLDAHGVVIIGTSNIGTMVLQHSGGISGVIAVVMPIKQRLMFVRASVLIRSKQIM